MTNDIPVELRPRVPRAPVGGEGGASAGFGLGGLSERAAELGGSVTAGRDDDSFRLALTFNLISFSFLCELLPEVADRKSVV